MRLLIASLSVLIFLFFAMEASAKIVFDSTHEGVTASMSWTMMVATSHS